MKEIKIIMFVLGIVGVVVILVFGIDSIAQWSVNGDREITSIENEQANLIQTCVTKGGVPSIGYRSFGFPKTYMERCDFPSN